MTHDEALKLAKDGREACGHCDPGPCDSCFAAAIEKACAERDSADHVGLMRVSGALCDAGTVAVPTKPTEYGLAVRQLTKQRDEQLARADQLKDELRELIELLKPVGYDAGTGQYINESLLGAAMRVTQERDQLQAQLVELQRIFHAETEAKATIAKHKDQLQAQVADLKTHLTTEESADTHRQEQELIQQLQAQVGALRAELDAFVYYSNDADNYYWRPNANSRSGGVGISLYRLLRDTASAAQAFEERVRKETLEALLEDVRVYFGKELPSFARRFSEPTPTPPETKR